MFYVDITLTRVSAEGVSPYLQPRARMAPPAWHLVVISGRKHLELGKARITLW